MTFTEPDYWQPDYWQPDYWQPDYWQPDYWQTDYWQTDYWQTDYWRTCSRSSRHSVMTKASAMMRSGRLTKTEEARKSGSFKKAKLRSTGSRRVHTTSPAFGPNSHR